jgi:epoxyqueuosine reductase
LHKLACKAGILLNTQKKQPGMITDILKNHLSPLHEYVFGTADLTGLIDEKFGEYRFGISIGRKLDDNIIDAIVNGPTLAYYKHYNQINKELAAAAGIIKNELQKMGIASIVIEPTISKSSKEFEKHSKTLSVDVSHKMVATRSGLGWIGKTDLFLSKAFGPRLRLVSLLINQKPDKDADPIDKSRCGKCNICVDKCPAQAANGLLWDTKTHRDTFFNAHKCGDKCSELTRQSLHIDEQICGICISVCPIGRKKK